MNKLKCWTLAVFATAGAASFAVPPPAPVFKDPLDVRAPVTRLLTSTQLGAVTRAGNRLVAVGIRGLIIISDDAGKTWTQASVPVGVELVAVQFVNAQEGWAAGHGGVVLHSSDGGKTWAKQYDGRMAARQLTDHFKPAADAGDATARKFLEGVALNYQNGPEQALLGLWFEDRNNGFVCGSFGTLLATHDGGKTWESWLEKVDGGDGFLHYNAIRGIGGEIYLASERGTVFRLDRQAQRFVATTTGYSGSFFGLAGRDNTVIAYGLRGTAYRTIDAGKSWQKLDTGVSTALDGGTVLDDGRILLVTQDGQILASADGGLSFTPIAAPRRFLFTDIAQNSTLSAVVVGLSGLQLVNLNK